MKSAPSTPTSARARSMMAPLSEPSAAMASSGGNRSGTPYGTAAAATAAQAPANQADCGKRVASRSTVTAQSWWDESSAMGERERQLLRRVVRRLGWGEQSAQGGVFE